MADNPKFGIESDGSDLFVVEARDGITRRIAKRGHPGTQQAGTWIAIEPGYEVAGVEKLTIKFNGVTIQ